MRKNFFIVKDHVLHPLTIRNYSQYDIEHLINIQKEAFPPPFLEELLWKPMQLKEHIRRFPQGAICAEVNQQLAGSLTSLVVNLQAGQKHTWAEITDSGYIRNHQSGGNTLYIVDVCVAPAFRGYGYWKGTYQSSLRHCSPPWT